MYPSIFYIYALIKHSAICTLLSAAPFLTLSDTIQRSRPLAWEISSRMRPTKTASLPTASPTGVGHPPSLCSSMTVIPGALSNSSRACPAVILSTVSMCTASLCPKTQEFEHRLDSPRCYCLRRSSVFPTPFSSLLACSHCPQKHQFGAKH